MNFFRVAAPLRTSACPSSSSRRGRFTPSRVTVSLVSWAGGARSGAPGLASIRPSNRSDTNVVMASSSDELPSHSGAKRLYVSKVMPPVPGIHRDLLVEGHQTHLGVAKRAGELARREHPQQENPPLMERVEQGERNTDRGRPRLRQFGPARFLVGLDGR